MNYGNLCGNGIICNEPRQLRIENIFETALKEKDLFKIIKGLVGYQILTIGQEEITLSSGIRSGIFFDSRRLSLFPDFYSFILNFFESLVDKELTRIKKEIKDECLFNKNNCRYKKNCFVSLANVPCGSDGLTSIIADRLNIPLVFSEKTEKNDIKMPVLPKDFLENRGTMIIEDVITTGGSILKVVKKLENAGLKVKSVVALLNRSKQWNKEISERKIRACSLFNLTEVLEILQNNENIFNLSEAQKNSVGLELEEITGFHRSPLL